MAVTCLMTILAQLIAEGISANSTAFLEESTNGEKPKGVGNPTEVALLLWLNKQGRDYLQLREQAHVLDQLTSLPNGNSWRTLVESPLIGKKILYIKGAPEIVLGKCKEVVLDGRQVDAVEYRSTVEAQLLSYQNMAMRTLGFAFKIVGENEPNDCTELVSANDPQFLGSGCHLRPDSSGCTCCGCEMPVCRYRYQDRDR